MVAKLEKSKELVKKIPLSRAEKEKEQSLIDLTQSICKRYNYQRKVHSETWIQIAGENRHLNSLDMTRIMDRSKLYERSP
jgi:hypothetical protein